MTTHPTARPGAHEQRLGVRRTHTQTARRARRRRTTLSVIAVALALVLGIAAVALLVGPPTAAQGHAVPIEGNRQHVDQGSDMPSLNRPPPSGDHYDSAPKSPRYRVTKMAVVPWSDMDQAVTTAAWDWIDGMDEPDVQRILAFYREHVDRGPEDAL